jgi:hypothetical protein
MNILSTRLEYNDRRHEQAENCPLKCPQDKAIREQNGLISLLLAVPNVTDVVFFNCLTVHVSTYVRVAGLVHTPGWFVALTQMTSKLPKSAPVILTPNRNKD